MIDPDTPVLFSADLKACAHLSSLSPDHVTTLFTWIIENAGATVVRSTSHHFARMGLTSVLILTESHAVIHTWPESGTVHLDIFSCSPRLNSRAAIAELGEVLGAREVTVQELPRTDGHPQSSAPCA